MADTVEMMAAAMVKEVVETVMVVAVKVMVVMEVAAMVKEAAETEKKAFPH